jgi:peptidyl-prolyl cis-trans isomerase D
MTVTEAELEAAYERRKSEYDSPERRTVQQIAFPTVEEASKARERLDAGADFLALAKERGLSEKDVSLGNVRKSDIADPALADAAFKLAQGEISAPVQGRLAVALLRVTSIEPGSSKPLSEVRDDLASKLRTEKAEEEVQNLHARVEDERAGGASLEEIGRTLGLTLRNIPSIDASGRDAEGEVVADIPAKEEVLALAFESDVGVENDPVSLGDDGVVWVDVRDAKPAATKPLAEVKAEAEAAFKAGKLREQLLKRARDLAARGDAGASIEELAGEAGAAVKTVTGVKRGEPASDFDMIAVSALFATADNGFTFAPAPDGKSAKVIHALPLKSAPFDPGAKDSIAVRKALEQAMSEDLLASYVGAVQDSIGVNVNPAVWQQLSGTPAN